MVNHSPAPFEFLEEGRTEEEFNVGRPLTIGCADHNDIAKVFSEDDAGVTTTREQAIGNARLFAASPALLKAIKGVIAATQAYLPPDGILPEEFIRRVLRATDNPEIVAALKSLGEF